MANRGTPLMARQSLIGFNYSLLGNFPARKRETKKNRYQKKKRKNWSTSHGASLIVCLLGPRNRIRILPSMTPGTNIIYADERALLIDDVIASN